MPSCRQRRKTVRSAGGIAHAVLPTSLSEIFKEQIAGIPGSFKFSASCLPSPGLRFFAGFRHSHFAVQVAIGCSQQLSEGEKTFLVVIKVIRTIHQADMKWVLLRLVFF
jgi:hypothetical protein